MFSATYSDRHSVLHDRPRMRHELRAPAPAQPFARVAGIMDEYTNYLVIGGIVVLCLLVVGGVFLVKLSDAWA